MKITSRKSGIILTILIALLLFSGISMTGCASRQAVMIPEGEKITITKGQLDQLTSDNELLIRALEECQRKK